MCIHIYKRVNLSKTRVVIHVRPYMDMCTIQKYPYRNWSGFTVYIIVYIDRLSPPAYTITARHFWFVLVYDNPLWACSLYTRVYK